MKSKIFSQRNEYIPLYNISECLKYFIMNRLKQISLGNCDAGSWHVGILAWLLDAPKDLFSSECGCTPRNLSQPRSLFL